MKQKNKGQINIDLMEVNRATCEIDSIIGKNIKKYRLIKNLSQVELAEELGMSFQQIQKYESGINRVASSTLIKISSFLGVNYTWLLDPIAGKMTSSKDKNLSKIEKEQKVLLQEFAEIKNSRDRALVLKFIKTLKA